MISQQYRAWSDCTDMQAVHADWPGSTMVAKITFGSSKIDFYQFLIEINLSNFFPFICIVFSDSIFVFFYYIQFVDPLGFEFLLFTHNYVVLFTHSESVLFTSLYFSYFIHCICVVHNLSSYLYFYSVLHFVGNVFKLKTLSPVSRIPGYVIIKKNQIYFNTISSAIMI